MGLSGISVTQLLIVLAIVILIFGTKKIATLGKDLGEGVKGVREGFGGDLGDAAEEIGRAKKSLEELRDRVNGLEASDLDSSVPSTTGEWRSVD